MVSSEIVEYVQSLQNFIAYFELFVCAITSYSLELCQSVCTYIHHTLGPGLLKRLLEVSVLQSDMEFLKYLIDDKKVDVSGEHMKFRGLCAIVQEVG